MTIHHVNVIDSGYIRLFVQNIIVDGRDLSLLNQCVRRSLVCPACFPLRIFEQPNAPSHKWRHVGNRFFLSLCAFLHFHCFTSHQLVKSIKPKLQARVNDFTAMSIGTKPNGWLCRFFVAKMPFPTHALAKLLQSRAHPFCGWQFPRGPNVLAVVAGQCPYHWPRYFA